MAYDMCPTYFAKNILQSFDPPPSAENPIVGICDGHGSHLTLELIDFCIANHIILVLRPPHTTHRLQVRAVQVDNINTRVESAWFQRLVSAPGLSA